MTRNILCLLLVRSLAVTDIKKQALSGCTFIYFSSKIKNMKKLFLTSIMLASCVAASAQNINAEETKTFDRYDFLYGGYHIPSDYTKDGKSLIAFTDGIALEENEGINDFQIYNDNLEHIETVKLENETYYGYQIIKKRIKDEFDNITWDETRNDEHSKTIADAELIIPISIASSNYDVRLCLTQTLFNDDEAYEYIMPIMELHLSYKIESDDDGDGEVDYIREDYEYVPIGFEIKSSNGQTIQTIHLNGLCYEEIYLLTINDKRYLGVHAMKEDFNNDDWYNEQELIFYPIKLNATGINPLGAPTKIKVSPRIADRSQSFTIGLDENSNTDRNVVVLNSAGQIVLRQKVPAGQNTVDISAARLEHGINIIRVEGTKHAESCKVIVK